MSVNRERTNVTKMQNAKIRWENTSASARLDTTAMEEHVKVSLDYLVHIRFSVQRLLLLGY